MYILTKGRTEKVATKSVPGAPWYSQSRHATTRAPPYLAPLRN